jgi:hypothetical protein
MVWGAGTTVAADAKAKMEGGRHVPIRIPLNQIFDAARREVASCAAPFRRLVIADE